MLGDNVYGDSYGDIDNLNNAYQKQKLVFEKKERSNYKPGLEKTINFFLKKNNYNHNFMENLKYLKIYEKIFR